MTMFDNAETGELFRSPSGLLTRTAWEDELESSFDQMPRWYRHAAERDRRFARWVHAEAKGLACHLDRLVRPDTKPALAKHLRAISQALWADAEWARHRIDGSMDEAA
jgi:hypothetical protein